MAAEYQNSENYAPPFPTCPVPLLIALESNVSSLGLIFQSKTNHTSS